MTNVVKSVMQRVRQTNRNKKDMGAIPIRATCAEASSQIDIDTAAFIAAGGSVEVVENPFPDGAPVPPRHVFETKQPKRRGKYKGRGKGVGTNHGVPIDSLVG